MPPNKFNVTRPDGSVTQVTPAQFERLSKLGYKKEEVEAAVSRETDDANSRHYNSAGQTILTAGEGLASGATLGLSDLVIDGESTKSRAKYNPVARIGGEVAGAVGAAVLSGGTSASGSAAAIAARTPAGLLARGANAVGRGVGGVKGAVVAGAAEGFVAGAGQTITRAKMDGEPLTAGSIFAGAGWSAVYGAGITGVVSGVAGIAEKSVARTATAARQADEIKKYANPIREEDYLRLKSTVEEFGAKSPEVSARASSFRGKAKTFKDEVAGIEDELVELDQVVGRTSKAADGEYSKAAKTVRDDHDTFKKGVDKDVAGVKKELGKVAKTLNKDFDTLASRYSQKEEFRDMQKALAKMPDDETRARAIMEFSGTLPEDVHDPLLILTQRFDELDNSIKSKLDDLQVKGEEVDGVDWDLDNARKSRVREAGVLTEAQKELASVRRAALTEELGRAQKSADQFTNHEGAIKTLDRFPKTAKGFAELNPRQAEEFMGALDALMQKADDDLHPLRDAVMAQIDGISSSAGVVVDSTGPVDKLRKMWTLAREADDAMKITAAKMAEEGVSQSRAAAGGLVGRIAKMAGARGASGAARDAGAGAMGSSAAYQLAQTGISALLGGPLGVVAHMSGIRAAVQARVISAVAKMAPTKNAYVRHTIPRIQPLSMKLDGTLDKSTKDKKQLATNRAIEISQASANIKEVMYKSMSPLIGEHTEFAAAMAKQGVEKFNMLLEMAPRDPGTAFNNMKSMWSVNPIQAEQFSRALQVFHNPLEVIEEFMSDISTIDPIRTDALKKFHPDLYQELRMAAIERVAEIGDMNYANQARLANLLDLNLHSSFSSQAIAARQAIFMEVPEESAMGSSSPNPGGRPAKSEPPTAGQSLQGK